MSVLTIVYVVISSVFALVFLIDCIRFRKQINSYVKQGILCGLILVAMDMAILLLAPGYSASTPVFELIVNGFVALVQITVFTCMGMYCCSALNQYDFAVMGLSRGIDERRSILPKSVFALAIATVVLAVGYSVVLFKMVPPHLSDSFKELSEEQFARLGVDGQPSLLMALIVLEFAFEEEIIFRLGIQNYLARQFKLRGQRYWIAVVLTASFWSLAHVNTLDPEWVKIAQVFPLGVALGFLFRRSGTEICIVVHGLFNLSMMFLGPYLIAAR